MEMQIICVQGKGHFLFFPGIEGDTGKGFQFKTRSGDFVLFPRDIELGDFRSPD